MKGDAMLRVRNCSECKDASEVEKTIDMVRFG